MNKLTHTIANNLVHVRYWDGVMTEIHTNEYIRLRELVARRDQLVRDEENQEEIACPRWKFDRFFFIDLSAI